MTPEAKVKKKLNDLFDRLALEGHKVYLEPRTAGGYSYRKGQPDYWAVINGRHIEFEIKREDGGQLSTMQIKWKKKFNDLGIPVYVINDIKDIERIIMLEIEIGKST